MKPGQKWTKEYALIGIQDRINKIIKNYQREMRYNHHEDKSGS